jgi:hypothetical protein
MDPAVPCQASLLVLSNIQCRRKHRLGVPNLFFAEGFRSYFRSRPEESPTAASSLEAIRAQWESLSRSPRWP